MSLNKGFWAVCMTEEFFKREKDGILIKIKAVPNSSKNEICGLYDNALKVKIKAPAVENKANEELINFFSKLLKVPKSSVILKSGDTSKLKTLYINNCTIDKLKNVCANINL